jgi:hypothetical protein
MTPTQRAEINRQNSLHSTGPKTSAGKQRSSLNALRHGLTSQVIVLPGEDLDAYRAHCDSFRNEYHPRGPSESHLVQSLADAAWRINRVAALENNLLTLGIIHVPPQLADAPEQVQQALSIAASLESQTRSLATLSLHSQRLHRQFEKTMALLEQVQLERRIHTPESGGEPDDAPPDGFVFEEEEPPAPPHQHDPRAAPQPRMQCAVLPRFHARVIERRTCFPALTRPSLVQLKLNWPIRPPQAQRRSSRCTRALSTRSPTGTWI